MIRTAKGTFTIPNSLTNKLPVNKGFGFKFSDNLGNEVRVMGPSNNYPNGYIKNRINNKSYTDINGNIPNQSLLTKDQILEITHFPIQ